jgi:hypothetical protein
MALWTAASSSLRVVFASVQRRSSAFVAGNVRCFSSASDNSKLRNIGISAHIDRYAADF